MANWSLPGLGDLYTNFLTYLKDRDVDNAKMFDGTSSTNIPTDAIGWSSTNHRFEKYNGASWNALDSSYTINVTSLGGQLASYYTDISNMSAGILPAARFLDSSHGNRGGSTLHAAVVASGASGFMTGADKAKLDAIEPGATGDMSANEILTSIKTVDGVASGLDADLLDGQESTYYARSGGFSINRALISDASGNLVVHGTTTNTEIGYLTGVTSNIQTQLSNKEPSFTKNTGFNKNLGTAAGTVSEGNHGHDSSYIKQGKHTIWIPSTAMVPNETNGTTVSTIETTTNDIMISTHNFDTSINKYSQFFIRMPISWDEGTITFTPIWSHAATTTNFGVVFACRAVALPNASSIDSAWGTSQSSADTGGTTDTLYIGPESANITPAGTISAGSYVLFQVFRDTQNGGDTLAIDARLHGVTINYTINAGDDT